MLEAALLPPSKRDGLVWRTRWNTSRLPWLRLLRVLQRGWLPDATRGPPGRLVAHHFRSELAREHSTLHRAEVLLRRKVSGEHKVS